MAETALPDDETLRALIEAGLRDPEIGKRYGVTRQAVGRRRLAMGIRKNMSHKEYRPWVLTGKDNDDRYTYLLTYYSRRQKGAPNEPWEDDQLDDFLAYLDEHQVVVDYNQVDGYMLRPRLPIDGDGIIRRPV